MTKEKRNEIILKIVDIVYVVILLVLSALIADKIFSPASMVEIAIVTIIASGIFFAILLIISKIDEIIFKHKHKS